MSAHLYLVRTVLWCIPVFFNLLRGMTSLYVIVMCGLVRYCFYFPLCYQYLSIAIQYHTHVTYFFIFIIRHWYLICITILCFWTLLCYFFFIWSLNISLVKISIYKLFCLFLYFHLLGPGDSPLLPYLLIIYTNMYCKSSTHLFFIS